MVKLNPATIIEVIRKTKARNQRLFLYCIRKEKFGSNLFAIYIFTFVVAQVTFRTDSPVSLQRAAAYQRLPYTAHCYGANDKIVYVGKDRKEQDKSNAVRCP